VFPSPKKRKENQKNYEYQVKSTQMFLKKQQECYTSAVKNSTNENPKSKAGCIKN
jgi:hypothetical protein